jgi:hypothetical protein
VVAIGSAATREGETGDAEVAANSVERGALRGDFNFRGEKRTSSSLGAVVVGDVDGFEDDLLKNEKSDGCFASGSFFFVAFVAVFCCDNSPTGTSSVASSSSSAFDFFAFFC